MADVWKHSRHQGGALLVLLAIGDHADDKGEAYPSVGTLAQKSRLSIRQVQRVLRQIAQSGELAIASNKGPKGCHKFRIQINQYATGKGDKLSGVTNCQGDISDIHGVTPMSPESSGTISKRVPQKKQSSEILEKGWIQFLAVYPKRVAKKDARRAWDKLNPDEGLTNKILAQIALAKKSEEWQKANGKFIPFPASWLNGRRWEDEIPASSPKRERLPL